MKILIVDDDTKRSTSLVNLILDKNLTNKEYIETVTYLDAARQLLKSMYFDILILDVVIPKRQNGKPNPTEGLSLLGLLSRTSNYNKPERIIGITAHIDDILRFKTEFETYCLTVIEAKPESSEWQIKILDVLSYTSASKLWRSTKDNSLHVITVHGIRTFGEWQKRFKNIVHRKCSDIEFHSYKYGVFSSIAFLVPFLRNIEVKKLTEQLHLLFEEHPNAQFIIFSHSFGTYLTAYSIKKILTAKNHSPVSSIVLSGSVLPQNFDWSPFRSNKIRVINDCADDDYVLYLSQTFVLGTGMAGRCGFHGFHDQLGVNRFFRGGHSSYFKEDDFMIKHWLPILSKGNAIPETDQRTFSVSKHVILDKAINFLGAVKPLLYIFLVIWVIYVNVDLLQISN